MDSIIILMTACLATCLYFLPWLIAVVRDHPQRSDICMLNLLLGWTLIGWLLLLVWAQRTKVPPTKERGRWTL